jgi:hypothetical protein
MNTSEAIANIRALAARSITSAASLAAWNDEAARFQDALRTSGDLGDRMPHFIWHYLADAALRFKDQRYAALQQRQLEEALTQMERDGAV